MWSGKGLRGMGSLTILLGWGPGFVLLFISIVASYEVIYEFKLWVCLFICSSVYSPF